MKFFKVKGKTDFAEQVHFAHVHKQNQMAHQYHYAQYESETLLISLLISFHSLDFLFDKSYFFLIKSIFGIKLTVYVRNRLCPVDVTLRGKVLQGNFCPFIAGIILRNFQYTKHCASKLRLNIFQAVLSLDLSVKSSNSNKSFCNPD